MSAERVFKLLLRNCVCCSSIMKLHLRLRIWVSLAIGYVVLMAFVILFHIPLRSRTFHSHYDMSDEGVLESAHSALRKVIERYAEAAANDHAGREAAHQINLLRETFKKADTNANEVLEMEELVSRISVKTKEHLSLALKENIFVFTAIDKNPRNGVVSWDEFHAYFLKERGYSDDFIRNHDHKALPRDVKEALMRDKAAWSEAYRDNPDQLSLDEFLAFRHPESSHATLLNYVEETIAKLDTNGDGKLAEGEFTDPELNEVPDDMTLDSHKQQRLKEFRIADVDKNGFVDRKELLKFTDPHHSYHAQKEALRLMGAADSDGDGVLTLLEVLTQRELFMASKMIDAAKSFHDEF